MKTILKRLTVVAILLFTLLSNQGFSQLTASPYVIYNTKACDVVVHYRVIDITGGSTCTVQCAANNVTITAFGSHMINCVVAFGSDIQLEIIDIGGQVLSPVPNLNFGQGIPLGGADWACFTMLTQTDSGTLTTPASSNCSSTTWSVVVGPNDVFIF